MRCVFVDMQHLDGPFSFKTYFFGYPPCTHSGDWKILQGVQGSWVHQALWGVRQRGVGSKGTVQQHSALIISALIISTKELVHYWLLCMTKLVLKNRLPTWSLIYLQVKAETDMYLRQLEMEGRVEEVSEELSSWLNLWIIDWSEHPDCDHASQVYGKGAQLILPTPLFVVKSKNSIDGTKAFINVCTSDKVCLSFEKEL